MNDDELGKRLRDLPVPNASETARERAKHRSLLAFRNGSAPQPRARFAYWRWAAEFTVCVIVIAVAAFWPRGERENLAADRTLLREIERVFPNQVNSVIQSKGQTNLSLTSTNEMGGDQPVLLVFTRNHEVVRVLSFSGRHVCVPLGGGVKCFEILATADGGVILEGEKEAVLPSSHPTIAGYSLRAQALSL